MGVLAIASQNCAVQQQEKKAPYSQRNYGPAQPTGLTWWLLGDASALSSV